MANDYEQRARERKAQNLTSHFRGKGVTAEQISKLSPEEREAHATQAGVKTPSEETWQRTLSLVQFLERNPGPADPFEGL
jgi:hypothetical protein